MIINIHTQTIDFVPRYFIHIVMSHPSHPMLSTNQLIYCTHTFPCLFYTFWHFFLCFMSHCFDTHQHYSSGKKINDLLPTGIFHEQILNQYINSQRCRNRGGRLGVIAPPPSPVFGRSVNPIPTLGEQIMPTTLLPAPQIFGRCSVSVICTPKM